MFFLFELIMAFIGLFLARYGTDEFWDSRIILFLGLIYSGILYHTCLQLGKVISVGLENVFFISGDLAKEINIFLSMVFFIFYLVFSGYLSVRKGESDDKRKGKQIY
jgi:hypothetical protein